MPTIYELQKKDLGILHPLKPAKVMLRLFVNQDNLFPLFHVSYLDLPLNFARITGMIDAATGRWWHLHFEQRRRG